MSASKETSERTTSTSTSPLALPAPDVSDRQTFTIDQTIRLDELGPMIVNSDGTLSRIANWNTMTPQEQERTIRVIAARNKQAMIRLANEEKKLKVAGAVDATTSATA